MAYPFFVLCLHWSAFGQDAYQPAYNALLNLQFEESRQLLASQTMADDPFLTLYIENLNDIAELFFTEDDSLFDVYQSRERQRIRQVRNLEVESPYKRFIQAEIKLQWSFVRLKFGHQWDAAWGLRSAYKTIKRNIKAHPDFPLNQKSMGLLHVIFGAVPDRYQWILGLFGLDGDVVQGVQELSELQTQNTLFQPELRMILALIQSYLFEEHEKALDYFITDQKSSVLEDYAHSLVLMKSHNAAKAQLLLKENQERLQNATAPIFQYLLAETYFQSGDYEQAIAAYSTFLGEFKGQNNIKDAYLKICLSHHFLGDQPTAIKYFEQAKITGKAENEVDKNAQKMLEAEFFPNPRLLQIRYAIDGGYYLKADSLMTVFAENDITEYEQVELNYRRARLYQLQNRNGQALGYYSQVIALTETTSENYFTPNSYLQMGYIYMAEKDSSSAAMYLKKVLDFKKHPYKNSLDSKAKIALKMINE